MISTGRLRRLGLFTVALVLAGTGIYIIGGDAGSVLPFEVATLVVLLVLLVAPMYLRSYHPVQFYSVLIAVLPWVGAFYNNRALGYLRHNDYEPGLRDIERAIQMRPGMSQAYSNRGLFYVRQGRYREAIEEYDEALRRKPRRAASFVHATALCGRAAAWSALGDYQRAIQDYTQALALKPKFVIALGARSQTFSRIGELERARADASMAVKLSPRSPIARNARGLLYTRLGEYQLALQEFDRAHAHARSNRLVIAWDTNGHGIPYRAMVLCNRAGTWIRMRDYARALYDCDQAVAEAPRYGHAQARRGIACLGLSDLEGARGSFATGIAANEGFALNGLLLNWLDLSTGAPAQEVAARLERVAATAAAHLPATPVCIGAARYLRQDYEQALPELERALAWEPDAWTAHFWLGMVRASSGQEDELAEAAVRRALDLGMPPILAGPLEHARQGLLPGQA